MTEALYQGAPLFKGIPIKTVREMVEAARTQMRRRTRPAAPDAPDIAALAASAADIIASRTCWRSSPTP